MYFFSKANSLFLEGSSWLSALAFIQEVCCSPWNFSRQLFFISSVSTALASLLECPFQVKLGIILLPLQWVFLYHVMSSWHNFNNTSAIVLLRKQILRTETGSLNYGMSKWWWITPYHAPQKLIILQYHKVISIIRQSFEVCWSTTCE